MKKIILLLIILFLVGCDKTEVNNKPKIEGVNGIECMANSTVDLLNGVVAFDKEDGDITPKMQISITPYVEVTDGYAMFEDAGNYKITYSVQDSVGNTETLSSDVSVVAREKYVDFSQVGGFYVKTAGHAVLEKGGLYNGEFLIVARDSEIAEDVSLNRVYNLKTNCDYTFNYSLWTEHSGRIRILIDGNVYEERVLVEGENKISFSYNTKEISSFTVSILLGDLGENVNCKLNSAYHETPQEEGLVELVNGISVEGRFHEQGSETDGYVSDNKVIVTKASDAMWKAGMFVNTNVNMEVGQTYEVSFTIERKSGNECVVALQNKQWDEKTYEVVTIDDSNLTTTHSLSITVTDTNVGILWLYVQSGMNENEIKISNISVKTFLSGNKIESILLEDFYNSNDGFNCEFNTFPGGFTYYIETFAEVDYQQKVTSPVFYIAGSGKNYIISFKAKASKPTEVVFAAPIANGWDPNWIWKKFTITEAEQTFTFTSTGQVTDAGNVFVWQFGSYQNKKYSNVTIEISDISIYYKNSEYDGD